MLGGTLYLVGIDVQTKELVSEANSCSMCKRMIINAGVEKVVIRRTPTEYEVIHVRDWIYNDDTVLNSLGY